MRKLLKDKTGSVPVLTFGFVFVLLILTFLTVEMGSTYENYDYCMDVLQRSCNSAVEANIDDTYRADKSTRAPTRSDIELVRSLFLQWPIYIDQIVRYWFDIRN